MKYIGKFFVSLYMWFVLCVGGLIVILINIFRVTFLSKKQVFHGCKNDLKILFKICFIKVTLEYEEGFNENEVAIFMPNHVSFFDVPIICSTLPNYTFGIEKKSHFSWPLYGYFIGKYGQLPIDRKNMFASMRTFEQAAVNMKATGASLLCFPEGTRSHTGKLGTINSMPMAIAKTMKVPIVPVGMSGFWDLSPKGGFFLTPKPVKIKYGRPIPADEVEKLDKKALAQVVRDRIIELCDDDIV